MLASSALWWSRQRQEELRWEWWERGRAFVRRLLSERLQEAVERGSEHVWGMYNWGWIEEDLPEYQHVVDGVRSEAESWGFRADVRLMTGLSGDVMHVRLSFGGVRWT